MLLCTAEDGVFSLGCSNEASELRAREKLRELLTDGLAGPGDESTLVEEFAGVPCVVSGGLTPLLHTICTLDQTRNIRSQGAPFQRRDLQGHGLLLTRCGENMSLLRYWLRYGILDMTTRSILAPMCVMLKLKVTRAGERKAGDRSRLRLTCSLFDVPCSCMLLLPDSLVLNFRLSISCCLM